MNYFHKTKNPSNLLSSNDSANQLLKSNHLFLAVSIVLYIFSFVYMFSLLDSDSPRMSQNQVFEYQNSLPELLGLKFKLVHWQESE